MKNDMKKAYLAASAKADTLALQISHYLGTTEAFRNRDKDTWADVATLNQINDKLEEVLFLVRQYNYIRVEAVKEFNDPKPEVFYTGGGIWLSAMYVDDHHYYVVDNDWECLSYFDNSEEDDTNYCCQNMVWSKDKSELNPDELKVYTELKEALEQEAD